jgi:hypothetical protein
MKAVKTLSYALLAAALLAAGAASAQTLRAVRFKAPGPLLDPKAAVWRAAPEVKVAMMPQTMTVPTKPDAAVKQIKVRAAHNGQWLAIRLEWSDPTKGDRIVTDQFGDQVAVEFPIDSKPDALPSPMMGNPGGRVNILQWRAAFQRDMEEGEPEVRTLYPNALVDLYPDQVLRVTDARPYQGALGMDNPVSRPKQSPVLDQMAEGWGTMTVKPDQHADGKGLWENGKWRVVITLPLATESTNSPRFAPGGRTMMALAVWEGGNREVGSRKSWSSWTPIVLAK